MNSYWGVTAVNQVKVIIWTSRLMRQVKLIRFFAISMYMLDSIMVLKVQIEF